MTLTSFAALAALALAAGQCPDPASLRSATVLDDSFNASLLAGDASTPAMPPEGSHSLLNMLPGLSGATWVDLGGGLRESLPAAHEKLRMFAEQHTVLFSTGEATLTGQSPAPMQSLGCQRQSKVVLATTDDVPTAIGVACGSADVVTLCHSLVAEDDWAARLDLAKSLLKPGGLLAVCDLAKPSPAVPTAMGWRRAVCAMRSAFRSAARPRGAAPHHEAVVRELRALSVEIHADEVAAGWPLSRRAQAPHFVFVGRVRSTD